MLRELRRLLFRRAFCFLSVGHLTALHASENSTPGLVV